MRYISWRELADRLSVSLSTAKRLQKEDPEFPRLVRLSPQRRGFLENDVDQYMRQLADRAA